MVVNDENQRINMAKRNVINNINIICAEEQNDNFAFYCEFFKLCGFFVIKSINEKYNDSNDFQEADTYLDIRKEEYIWTAWDAKKYNKISFVNLLRTAIYEAGLEEYEELEELAEIYVDHHLMRINILERFYYKKKEYIDTCVSHLDSAISEMSEILDKRDFQFKHHTQFFRLTCKLKVNIFLEQSGGEKEYPTAQLINEALAIDDKNSLFDQKFVLAAMIADKEKKYQDMQREFLGAAMRQTGPQKAYVEYRLARYFEKISKDDESALKYYKSSYEKLERNYRAVYKIANLYSKKGENRTAVLFYQEVCRLIIQDVHSNFAQLQPIQLEYLYKTYLKMYIILLLQNSHSDVVKNIRFNIEKIKDLIDNNEYIINIMKAANFSQILTNQMILDERKELKESIVGVK